MNLTQMAIERSRVTLVVAFFVLLGGFLAYQNLPRAEDPGFPIRTALVRTYFPGASPERVENLISDKIEKAVQEMPELDSVTSQNKTGASFVFVNLDESYDDLRPIWDSMRRKVDGVRGDLPDGVIGPFINDEFGDVFGTIIGVTGDGYTYAELEDIADEVRDELLRLPDAAKVEIHGAQEERVFIEFKNERLAELGISPSQLQAILTAQNIVIPGGRIHVDTERYALEPTGSFESVEEIANTLIQIPGAPEVIPLEDVVRIERGYVDPPDAYFHNSGTPGLALAMSMREGGNLIALGKQTKELLARLEAQYPIGVELEILVFQPDDVDTAVRDFTSNLLQAVGIVMGAMILMLGLRTGFVVASLIPTAVAASLLIMSLFDIGLDQMSLASLIIALGMLVDNAVVMAESIMVQLGEGKKPVAAAVDSATELRTPLLVSSLTTCAAFLPIYLAESSTGEYTAPLFKVVSITLLSSWFIAITMVPLLCAVFLKVKSNPSGQFNTRFYRAYRGGLIAALKHPIITLLLVGGVFFVAMRGFANVPQIFFPPANKAAFTIDYDLPIGSAIEETRETTVALEKFMNDELRVAEGEGDGILHWSTFVGQGAPRFYLSYNQEQQTPEHVSFVVATTTEESVGPAVDKVREYIFEHLPDVRATVKPRALGPGFAAPVMFEILGKDPKRLFEVVAALEDELERTPGTTNVRNDWGQRTKKLVVQIDPARIRRAGLTNQDVAVSLQTALSGFQVTEYREGSDVIPVMLRSVAADRDDLAKLESLSVFSQANGTAVPLKQVADVELVWHASKVLRKDRLKSVTVLSDLEAGTTAVEVNTAISPWLDDKVEELGVGYRWELAGEGKSSEEANASIAAKLPIAGFIIVMLLVGQFNSIRRPLIILFTIPLALIGVVVGLLGFKSYFGFMTLLGVIALAGIVINNAIVLLDRIRIEIDDNGLPPARAIVESAQRRFRPILLTTVTTMVGLVPLWLGGGPMWEPMAISIIFGLLFSTVLTLGVVPVLYSLFFRVRFKGFRYDG